MANFNFSYFFLAFLFSGIIISTLSKTKKVMWPGKVDGYKWYKCVNIFCAFFLAFLLLCEVSLRSTSRGFNLEMVRYIAPYFFVNKSV